MDYSAHLNNLGATALEKGDYDLAMQLLRRALDVKLANVVSGPSSSSSSAEYHPWYPQIDEVQAAQLYQVVESAKNTLLYDYDDRASPKQPSSSTSRDSYTGGFVYEEAFVIEPAESSIFEAMSEPSSDQSVSPQCAARSATLLFNMGLLHHLKAPRTDQATNKALTLYGMALGLVKEILTSTEEEVVDSRLVVAILNNIGELHYEQSQFVLSKRCFSNLATVLHSMSASGTSSCIDASNWSGLIMNTMVLSDPKVARAA